MHTVVVEREMDVQADRAWSILDDFGGIYRFHPNVEKSSIQNGIDSGLGAERVCHFDNGDQVREQITGYEAGEEVTVEITDPGNLPLKTAVANIALTRLENNRSRVRFKMSFQPKYGPIGWLMGATVMQSQFRKILSQVLAGLETHAQTGEIVGRRDALAIPA